MRLSAVEVLQRKAQGELVDLVANELYNSHASALAREVGVERPSWNMLAESERKCWRAAACRAATLGKLIDMIKQSAGQ